MIWSVIGFSLAVTDRFAAITAAIDDAHMRANANGVVKREHGRIMTGILGCVGLGQ